MKNILHYILIAVIVFLIGVIIYQHNIIKNNHIEIEEQKCISDTSSITKMSNCVEASIPK